MKKVMLIFLPVMLACVVSKAQVKIGDNPASISPGSLLELESTSKALTLPRMTTVQMEAIPSPLSGMIVFNTDSNCIYLYKAGNVWASINSDPNQTWPYQSNDQAVGSSGNAKGIISLTGNGLVASGDYSHAEGLNSISSGAHSWSFGLGDTALSAGSSAIGYQNKAAGAYSFALGFKNITAFQSAMAFGQENQDSGWASMAMGLQNSINNEVGYSNAIGYGNQVKIGFSHNALGEFNIINSGRANTGIGFGNMSDGNYNTLFGNGNKVIGGNSHVLGGFTNTVKAGSANSLFGWNNSADGLYLGAIGKDNTVFFQSGVALGQGNMDSGWASIAGGLGNIIEKEVQYSASFGFDNISTRNLSLAIPNPGAGTFTAGLKNINSGYGSVALGAYNQPTNLYSLSANFNTLANSSAMSAFGHFNDTIPAYQGESYEPGEMLFSIGNGINSDGRRNSLTMLRNGFTTINTTENLGPNVPRAELDIKGTGAIIVPVGTTEQRPPAPVVGMIRVCTDCGSTPVLQGYDGSSWVNL